MKYKDIHGHRPPINELIVWVGPPFAIEVFGYYRGGLTYEPIPGQSRPGYIPKYWREVTVAEKTSYEEAPNVINLHNMEKPKRGRPKKP